MAYCNSALIGGRVFDASQCEFELTPYRADELLRELRAEYFPELRAPIAVMYARIPNLARIFVQGWGSGEPHVIQMSSLLNQPGTPIEVVRHILIHELLHLVVGPGECGGRQVKHTSTFWERERELSPDADLVVSWLFMNFGRQLVFNERQERIDVRKDAYKSYPVLDPKAFAAFRAEQVSASGRQRVLALGF
jgi:hypothetical protein